MENKNELEYQEKLNVLERHRESLELVMQKMDEEWEERYRNIQLTYT
jgi:hypothetical protein